MKLLTHALPAALLTAMVSLSSMSYADDTEIYFARANADNDQNRAVANVLIMLDTSGSMRFCEDELSGGAGYNAKWCTDYSKRRINILQNAIDQLLDSVSPSIRLGIGRFNYRAPDANRNDRGTGQLGGRIMVPVTDLNPNTKALIRTQIATLNSAGDAASVTAQNAQPVGDTPTARAYSEAARYMLGMAPFYGTTENGGQANICAATSTRTVCRDVEKLGSPYKITFSAYWNCPTDATCYGEGPVWDRTYWRQDKNIVNQCSEEPYCSEQLDIVNNSIYASPMNLDNSCESNHIILFTDGAPSDNDKPTLSDVASNCSSEKSSYTCQKSIATYLNSTSNAKGREVFTHNIGLYMGNNESNMKGVSDAGNGSTSNADSAEELIAAFLKNLDLIDEQARSIAAPGVAVNTLSRFQHLDELFYSVFEPAESSYWEGNLKKYKWAVKDNGDGEIQGVGKSDAIDPTTGYFRDGSRSFWSTEVDGRDVTKGGARENVPAQRRLFLSSERGGALTQVNWDSESTPSKALLGLGDDDDEKRIAILSRLKTMWSDPLHSVPVVVNYDDNDAYANVAFISTNGGMLHAVDTKTGSEKFAFMPYEFISQASRYTTDRPALGADNKRLAYGLDGSWVAWKRSAENGSKVYLYGGMRRGGQQYYALDVSDPDTPKMLWQIGPETDGFAQLGQTWSTPTLTQVWTNDEVVPALVFGGGYSAEDHDDYAERAESDRMGNAIFVVNALTGDLIWSAGGGDNVITSVGDMKWSVPSSISVVDTDFDGIADHFYFGDLGGQLFRVDLPQSSQGAANVVRIAELGDNSGAEQRRFYEAPAVAYVNEGGSESLYVVASSGYRAHPLNETALDGIFVIRDNAALQGGGNTVATLANMVNVAAGNEANGNSWYYKFSEDAERLGEKALSSPTIFDGKILQSTYAPTQQDEDDNPCSVRYGEAFLHTVDLRTGGPASLSGDAPDSRSQGLDQSTPPPTPTLLVNEEGELVVVVGTEVIGKGDFGNPNLRRHRWMQLPRDEANKIKLDASGKSDEEDAGQ